MVALTMKLAETEVKITALRRDFAAVPFSLWTGTDDVGRSISCWIPDWIPETFFEVAQKTIWPPVQEKKPRGAQKST